MKSFGDVQTRDIIDVDWLARQDAFLKSLTAREVFLMFGYSFNGDTWAHAHLDNRFDLGLFHTTIAPMTFWSSEYFAFFFQARELYKINMGTIEADYNEVIKRCRADKDVKNIRAMAQMFINELNNLILKAPKTTRDFYVFRGMKDDAYLTGMKDKQYMTNRFSSASVDGYGIAYGRFSGEDTLQRIKILKGSSCLCMFGTSKFKDEYEILLPRGSTYVIRHKSEDMHHLNPVYPNSVIEGPDKSLVKKLVDVTLFAAPATPVHKKGAVHIKVPIAPANAANVAKVQRLISARLGVTGKLGQGASGAVYLGTTNNGANYAIKMQKVGRNSNLELKALRKLKNTGVVPRLRGTEVLNWNKNFKNLMPRLINGNKVSVIYQNRVEGVPLGSFFTGTGVTANMKQRIANAMTTIHKKGVIHGNLHRDNVIIGKNGKPYLIDFGKSYMRPNGTGFKNSMNANRFLKHRATGSIKKAGKMAYYMNKANLNNWHFSNQNFLNRLTTK
jgi:predicted Ser/Thr protein kinase